MTNNTGYVDTSLWRTWKMAKTYSIPNKIIYRDKLGNTVKLGYIKLGFYEYMVYIKMLSRPERNLIDFYVK